MELENSRNEHHIYAVEGEEGEEEAVT